MEKSLLILKKCTVGSMAILFILLFFQSIALANEFRESKEHDLIWKNAYTSLFTLANVLNNPNTNAIVNLNRIINSDSVSVTDFITNTSKNNPLLSQSNIQLDIININKLSEGYMVRVRCLLHINKYQFLKEFSIRFSFINNSMKFSDFQKTLLDIQNFKDETYKELNKIPQKKITTSVQKSLSITNYQSDNLINKIDIYNSPQMSLLDASSSQSVFGNIIFSRPYGILAYKFVDVEVTNFSHDLLIATDANWDRLIASDDNYDNDWIKAIGSNGSGNYGYRSPQGVDNLGMNKVFVADGWNNRVQAYDMMLESASPSYSYAYTISDSFIFVADVAVGYIPHSNYTTPLYDSALVAVLDKGNCRVNFYDENGNFKSSLRANISETES